MAKRCSKCNRLIAPKKGIFGCACEEKGEIKNEIKPNSTFPKGSGMVSYTIARWVPSCSKCGKSGCLKEPRECGEATWFPIYNFVSLRYVDGKIVSSSCRQGRKPGGALCMDKECENRHIGKAVDVLCGVSNRNVELSGRYSDIGELPKCPNCREKWGITALANGKFECRNPTCVRDDRPWVFDMFNIERPIPLRNEWKIRDKEPGRVLVKPEHHKRWGTI